MIPGKNWQWGGDGGWGRGLESGHACEAINAFLNKLQTISRKQNRVAVANELMLGIETELSKKVKNKLTFKTFIYNEVGSWLVYVIIFWKCYKNIDCVDPQTTDAIDCTDPHTT